MALRSFHLNFAMDNAAFEESPLGETVRILRSLADEIERGDFAIDRKKLRDVNGNTIGFAEFE